MKHGTTKLYRNIIIRSIVSVFQFVSFLEHFSGQLRTGSFFARARRLSKLS